MEVESTCATPPIHIIIDVLVPPNELPISVLDQSIVFELEVSHVCEPLVSQSRILIVFTRRKGATLQDSKCQPPEPDTPFLNLTGENITSMVPLIDDAKLPIAQQKGVRSYTSHPIKKSVTYEQLLLSY